VITLVWLIGTFVGTCFGAIQAGGLLFGDLPMNTNRIVGTAMLLFCGCFSYCKLMTPTIPNREG
jgi:hypothetical protein